MHADFNKRHEVSHCSSPQLQRYSFPGILTVSVTKCPPNVAPQVRIDSCIYLKTKIALIFGLRTIIDVQVTNFCEHDLYVVELFIIT